MKYYLSTFLLFFFALSFSQVKLEGYVKDSIGNSLELANVIAINKATSALDSYAITNEQGRYRLSLKKNTIYSLQVSYIGMKSANEIIETFSSNIIKDFILKEDNVLDEVELTYEMPVTVSGDTLTYDADSFNKGTERKLEDVLENLPGVEINDDGQIEVEGKVVQKVMVEGKDFFDGDSKLATKNIPSNAVDKVQVLKNYAEIGQLSGVTNNQDNIAINIKLKEGKKNFWFGNVMTGAGEPEVHPSTEPLYLFQPKLFYYSPKYSINFIGDLGKSDVLKSICEKNIDKSKIYAILDDESEKKKVFEAAECFYFEYGYSCNLDGIIDYMSMAHSLQDPKIYEAVIDTQTLFNNIKDFKILNEDNFGTFSIGIVAEIVRETESLQKSSNTTIRKFLNIEDMFLSNKAKEEMKIDRQYAVDIMKNLIALLQSFSLSMFATDSLKIDQKEWVQISIFISDLFEFINEICIEQNAIISKSTDIFSFDVKDPSKEMLNALMLESIHLIEVLHAYAYKEGFNELFSKASYENFIEAYLFVSAFNDSSDISKMIRMNGIAKKIENREAQLDFLTHQILQKQLIDIESKKIIFQDNPNLIFSQRDVMEVIDEYKTKLRKHFSSRTSD